VANQSNTKSHISYCVTAKSHIIHTGTHEHQPSFPHSHTYLSSAKFIENITHQHDNDRTLKAVCCYACYLVRLLVIMVKASRMKRVKEPHAAREPRVGYP